MPFEIFKPPKIHGAIGSAIGKGTGVVIAKGFKTVTNTTNKLRAKGCPGPAEMSKISGQIAQVGALSGTLTSQLATFKSIPGGLRGPVGGIRAAVNVILALPVPQAIGVPPGPPGGLIFAQPTNFTTKFADLLNLLKEFAAALELTADAIDFSLKSSSGSIGTLSNSLKTLEGPVKACKIDNAIKSKLTKEQAGKLGLLDKDGELITSTFGSKVLEPSNTRPASEQLKISLKNSLGLDVNLKGSSTIDEVLKLGEKAVENGLTTGDAFRLVPPGTFKLPSGESEQITGKEFAVFVEDKDTDGDGTALKLKVEKTEALKPGGLTGKAQALAELDSALIALSDKILSPKDSLADELGVDIETLEELKKDLEDLSSGIVTKKDQELEDPELSYKGYLLKIIRDPASPKLAPKHFAVGIKDGVQKIKGPSSFSSSTEVLLNEIKFRIDNQLS